MQREGRSKAVMTMRRLDQDERLKVATKELERSDKKLRIRANSSRQSAHWSAERSLAYWLGWGVRRAMPANKRAS